MWFTNDLSAADFPRYRSVVESMNLTDKKSAGYMDRVEKVLYKEMMYVTYSSLSTGWSFKSSHSYCFPLGHVAL